MDALAQIDDWPVETVGAAVVLSGRGIVASRGAIDHVFPLASVTKLLTAQAVLLAVEEGVLELDDAAGPPGATLRHLLAHASGLSFDGDQIHGKVGQRRIYSNGGYALLGQLVAERSGFSFADYFAEGVAAPLGMTRTAIIGPAGHAGSGSVTDIAAIAGELLAPTLLAAQTHAAATSIAYPGLSGVLPGFGVQRPNDWGLGPEIKGRKHPHWTGNNNAPETVGHFGQSGTLCWADPVAGVGLVVLTDRNFGDWARERWPVLSDAVLAQWVGVIP